MTKNFTINADSTTDMYVFPYEYGYVIKTARDLWGYVFMLDGCPHFDSPDFPNFVKEMGWHQASYE